jgi:cytochrome c peroxidase
MEYGRANSPSLMNLTLPARADAATAGTKKQDTQTVLSSEAEPLAQPKSPQQTGVPADATRAAIPSDNPQTSGKIALGQKLFFERRLSADGAVACSNCQ